MAIREKYAALKAVAIDTLRDFEEGVYYDGSVNFERTKKYPYPQLRWAIANELYNEPCTTLSLVGRVLGVKHCTLSVGLYKFNDIVSGRVRDTPSKKVIDLFQAKLRECANAECRITTDLNYKDYIGIIASLPEDEKQFYADNDDLYIAFSCLP